MIIERHLLSLLCTFGGYQMEKKTSYHGNFVEKSQFIATLSNPRFVLAIDNDDKHLDKESPHWHLCHNGVPIARITAYGCWTSWPPVSPEIKKEAEKLTAKYMISLIRACHKSPITEPQLISKRAGY